MILRRIRGRVHRGWISKLIVVVCPSFESIRGTVLDVLFSGAHGFSALIETQIEGDEPHYTLFDTGPESKSIARNIAAMHIPVEKISRVVLSHWHSDHSGGILSFLNVRRQKISSLGPNHTPTPPPCVVDLHPDRPIARGIAPNGPEKVMGQLNPDPTFEEIEEAGGVVEKRGEGHAVAGGGVWVSGEIPRLTWFEEGLHIGAVRFFEEEGEAKGKWVLEQHIMDERYAAIDVAGKGLVIFSSCSHAGIVNVVRDAIKTFNRPVHMIIGGLHLASSDLLYRIAPTVEFFSTKMRPSPTYVLPMHCTGFTAKVALEKALGEGCVPASTGMRIEVVGDREVDKGMFPPVVEDD
ncbi:hypothetical protein NLI96_g11429 [Meripilus lineatus]|uniref:Metallo-beta-lactamase domain-containing protein n=1 Tax=Meripilus lineatus TaxID=2056292 RepID=A0AAD5URY2_9APHY|nr:hypothetical protein NLI96_g11429 [Physisporinus lineatus]